VSLFSWKFGHSLGFLALKNSYEVQKMSSWYPWIGNEVLYMNMQ